MHPDDVVHILQVIGDDGDSRAVAEGGYYDPARLFAYESAASLRGSDDGDDGGRFGSDRGC